MSKLMRKTYLYKQKRDTSSSLAPQLAQMKSANPKIKVHLRGDARLNYGAIAVVAGEIRNAGIQVIALRTDLANLKSEIEAFPKENVQ